MEPHWGSLLNRDITTHSGTDWRRTCLLPVTSKSAGFKCSRGHREKLGLRRAAGLRDGWHTKMMDLQDVFCSPAWWLYLCLLVGDCLSGTNVLLHVCVSARIHFISFQREETVPYSYRSLSPGGGEILKVLRA